MESNKSSPRDVLRKQHDYDLLLLNQEIDTPSDNLHHQDTHVCEKQDQDDFLIHATNLSHNFALPQFMAQHNCEDLKSPYQVSQANLSISLTSQYPPDPGEHVLMKSAC